MHNQEMDQAITNAQECAKICNQTLTHCISTGGKHTEPSLIKLLTDCAKICETSANFMARESDHHGKVCGVCADICEACAKSCKDMGGEEMEKCAEACLKCAASCRVMASYTIPN